MLFIRYIALFVWISLVNGFVPREYLHMFEEGDVLPEVFMNSIELIQYNGYPAEKHNVKTEDGFILEVHRIPHGRNNKTWANRPVVLIQHGLLADSSCFLFNGWNGSLGFILSDAGYDVWLGNVRGNTYSMKHTKYNASQDQFWDFSWQDMAYKDLPSMVDYILNLTNQSQLVYIGHSQGTCMGFAGFSKNKELSKKIKLFIALGPVAKVQHVKGLLLLILNAFKHNLNDVFDIVGRKGILMNSTDNMVIADRICDTKDTALVCRDTKNLIYGHGLTTNIDWRRIPVYMAHSPSGSSVRNIVHFGQEIISGEYQLYDFGSDAANSAHYNQTTPPLVDLTQVQVPVALYSGSNDWLADPIDVKFISDNLKNVVENKQYAGWNHVDFIVGNTPAQTLYKDILKLMAKINA